MISKKLKNIFLISIPIFIAHGLEEYFADFYNVDNIFKFVFRSFETMTVLQATFLLFQIMIWLLLIISFLFILGGKWPLRLMLIPGLVYIIELHHIYKTVISFSYYPGFVTALIFPILGFFFWRELLRNLRQH